MEGFLDVAFEESGELVAIAHGACLIREVLENHAGIVGAAEEGAVNAVGAAANQGCGSPDQRDAKDGAGGHAPVRTGGEEPREHLRKGGDHDGGNEEKKNQESALDEDVASAALQQDRDFHYAVLHDRVAKRERKEKEIENHSKIEPEGRSKVGEVRDGLFHDDRQNSDQGSPKDDAALPGDCGTRGGECISDQ